PVRSSHTSSGRARPVKSNAPTRMSDSASGRVSGTRARKSSSESYGRPPRPRSDTMVSSVRSWRPFTSASPTRASPSSTIHSPRQDAFRQRSIDAGRAHEDAATPRIGQDRAARIHALVVVHERDGEGGGMMRLQVRGLVGQYAVARRVRLAEGVRGETFELAPH